MKLEELPEYMRNEKYVIRWKKVDESTIFYYAHIKGQECSATPYERPSLAIEWAERETA